MKPKSQPHYTVYGTKFEPGVCQTPNRNAMHWIAMFDVAIFLFVTVWMQYIFRLHSADSSISICCRDVMKIHGGKPNYFECNLQCHYLHHKSHMGCPRIQP